MAAAVPAHVPAPPLARIDAEDQRISKMIQDDLKAYWTDPLKKVLEDPVRAIIYSVAIKALSWFVALIFPFIAYTTFGLSIALIDRIAYNHFPLFFQGIINSCKDFVNSRVRVAGDRIVDAFCGVIAAIPDFD